jgi:hypothetical protein
MARVRVQQVLISKAELDNIADVSMCIVAHIQKILDEIEMHKKDVFRIRVEVGVEEWSVDGIQKTKNQ